MLERLLTETPNPASAAIDTLPTGQMLAIINSEDRKVADAVGLEIPAIARAVDLIVERLRRGGRLFYIGAGTSGRLGVLDASECPPTFDSPPDMVQGIIAGGEAALSRPTEVAEDDASMGAADLRARGCGPADVTVGIAASGRTPYVLGAIEEAKRFGAATIGLSCTRDSELAKAGTAQKLVLNMLSTGAFIRLGYVYGNLMVHVQPNNSKLADRARRIVADAAGVPINKAADLLDAGGSVPVAIVMGKAGISREDAERRLEQAGGRISQALSGEKRNG